MSDELTEARLRNDDLHPLERAYLLQRVGRFDPSGHRVIRSRFEVNRVIRKLPGRGTIRYRERVASWVEFTGYSMPLWYDCVLRGLQDSWEGASLSRSPAEVLWTGALAVWPDPKGIEWVEVKENVLADEFMRNGWHRIGNNAPDGVSTGDAKKGETLGVQTEGHSELLLVRMSSHAETIRLLSPPPTSLFYSEAHRGPFSAVEQSAFSTRAERHMADAALYASIAAQEIDDNEGQSEEGK